MIAAPNHDRFTATRERVSPRYSARPVPARSLLIHAGALALWALLIGRAFGGGGVFAWSAGIVYIAYDTALLGFVLLRTLDLRTPPAPRADTDVDGPLPACTVIVAARDEALGLPVTIAALLAQTSPAERIVIADDGSTDGTALLLQTRYGLVATPGALSEASTVHPALHWLALPRGGKARALNVACGLAQTELVATVDADTLLDPPALGAMRRAFAVDPHLLAATGVLTPLCGRSLQGRLLQWFQTYEYVRNFLSRYAWMRVDGLLLISGAFGCYRRQALVDIGGFDPDCLVEDYELTHRLRDHAGRTGATCHTAVIGAAHARTDAPATLGAFLGQRRRWFGGFLQTQLWYRHMVGDPRYGHTGTMMLPVKAIDTLQPLYGLAGTVLLVVYAATGRVALLTDVGVVICAKLAIDLAFGLWSMRLYRRWTGNPLALAAGPGLLAILLEPFSFQILRHLGAGLGWFAFLTGGARWGAGPRRGIADDRGG